MLCRHVTQQRMIITIVKNVPNVKTERHAKKIHSGAMLKLVKFLFIVSLLISVEIIFGA